MATEITITNDRLRSLFIAIGNMDGRQEVAHDKDGKSLGLVVKPFDFEDGKARYALAKTRNLIRKAVTEIDNTLNEFRKDVPLSEPPHDDTAAHKDWEAKVKAYNHSVNEYLQKEVKAEIFFVKTSNLNIHTNKIAPALIEDLMPMMEGDLQ